MENIKDLFHKLADEGSKSFEDDSLPKKIGKELQYMTFWQKIKELFRLVPMAYRYGRKEGDKKINKKS